MATRSRKVQDEEASIPANMQPQVSSHMGHSALDAGFVWQQLSDIQKSLGAINAKLDQQKESSAKLDADLGKVKADVAEFKQIRHTAKVLGVITGVVLAGALTVTWFVVKEAWTVLKPLALQQVQSSPAPPTSK